MWSNELMNVLTTLLLAVPKALWNAVTVLAGGPEGAWWRWVAVEVGVLLALIAIAALVGRYVQRRLRNEFVIRWGAAAAIAAPFGLVWSGYGLLMSQAMNTAAHPETARELLTFTWALPLTVAMPVYAVGGVMMQVALAAALCTVVLMYLGEALA